MIDVLLAVVGTLLCLVAPSLVVALPIALAARLIARKHPRARVLVVIASGLAGGALSAVSLAVAGLVIAMQIESEGAGEALVFLVSAGLIGGGVVGVLAALLLSLVATRPSASSSPSAARSP